MPDRVIKITDVIANLQKIKKEHGNLVVIQCSDDEGNSYQRALYTPTPMVCKDKLPEACYDLNVDNPKDGEKANCVCIN